ncbi:MAG TPA: VTT domain-containing protein [Vicinamibacterales bacterium]|nr:VTT domain-containing protein [Vicinamibacterales bacterium]
MTARLVALAVATLVSEDLTTITAGLMVSAGHLPAGPALLACAAGIYAGDLGLWVAGRVFSTRVLSWPRVASLLPARSVQRFKVWFDRHSFVAVVASRFTPGTRLPLYVAAGACGTSFAGFARWSLVAVALWTPAVFAVSAAFGDQVSTWIVASRIAAPAAALLALVGWRTALRVVTRRGRQQLIATVSRAWRWEFWPMWLFYVPVGIWTVWLAFRYGGYRTLTAANPGMPDGGVVGESKYGILARLPSQWTIPAVLVESGEAGARLDAFQLAVQDRGWSFPLVVKPDVGQRGTGVRLVRDLADVAGYLRVMHGDLIVQPYHPGPFEAGVFYYRMPGWSSGRILSVTDKQFAAVVGDGRSTLEDLVWAHPRYRMQARVFLDRLGQRRPQVPGAGERVSLGIAGNHAQGTMFKDGRHLITPALESRIDAIAQAYDGFFIGRFDIRYRDRAAFMDGRDLAIVELNGATAECTNIYDPEGSLASAYRQLFLQWHLVFAIGAANRRSGSVASSPKRLRGLLRAHITTRSPLSVSD